MRFLGDYPPTTSFHVKNHDKILGKELRAVIRFKRHRDIKKLFIH